MKPGRWLRGAGMLWVVSTMMTGGVSGAVGEGELARVRAAVEAGDLEPMMGLFLREAGWEKAARPLTLGSIGNLPLPPGEAVVWAESAARRGHPEAKVAVVVLYFSERYPDLLASDVVGFLCDFLDEGEPVAASRLRLLMAKATQEGLKKRVRESLEGAAERGMKEALLEVGMGRFLGWWGWEVSREKGLEMVSDAAKEGLYEAAGFLGTLRSVGGVVRRDLERAEHWLRRAANGRGGKYLALLAECLMRFEEDRERWSEALLLAREAAVSGESAADTRLRARFVETLVFHRLGRTKETGAMTEVVKPGRWEGAGAPTASTIRQWEALVRAVKLGRDYTFPDLGGVGEAPGLEIDDDWIVGEIASKRARVGLLPGPLERWQGPSMTGLPKLEGVGDAEFPLAVDEWGDPVSLESLAGAEGVVLDGFAGEREELLRKFHEGDADATYGMASRLLWIPGMSSQQRNAGLELMRSVAGLGDRRALLTLGHFHETGYLLEVDRERAFLLYQEAAWSGDAEAMFRVGRAFEFGIGVEANALAAYHWLERAVVYDHPGAKNLLGEKLLAGRGVRQGVLRATELLFEAAAFGYAQAQFRLAELHLEGSSLPLNEEEAFFWANLAAQKEHAEAEYLVGTMLLEGRGCDQEVEQGVGMVLRSALRHHLPACREMARLYREGRVLMRDERRALGWLRRVASFGLPEDGARLARFLATCEDADLRDLEGAKRWLEKNQADAHGANGGLSVSLDRAVVLGVLGEWDEAVDAERQAYSRMLQSPLKDGLAQQARLGACLARQERLLRGEMPEVKRHEENPGALPPLPEDTILVQPDARPERPESGPKGPGLSAPWHHEYS